ncbi:MAG: hypothetical protein AB7V18_03915 [Pyrinomonadaceae bacterium]
MKLRILGNSLRFRLGRSEVEAFGRTGSISERVRFGSSIENDLRYELTIVDGPEFVGNFENGAITVGVPRSVVDEWVGSEEVSISGKQGLDQETSLKFLIEKDFVCLSAHNDEDQSDRYPHPKGPDAC